MTRLVRSLGAFVLDQLAFMGRMGLFLVYMIRGTIKTAGEVLAGA